MSSVYSRTNYSPYTKGNPQETEQLPLRSKAFSQIDNTAQNYSQAQYTNGLANQDKISEIKKKYDKLLSKSSNKSNQENVAGGMSTHDYGKSVSNFEANDENSRWSMYSRPYQTPTSNKQRRIIDPYEGVQAKNVNPRPYAQRDYYNQPKTDIKSQLQSNRVTLNAMKSELQSKLNDLTAKTTGSSMLRNSSNPPKEPEKKDQIETNSYEAILSKYSKNISQTRGKSAHDVSAKDYQKYRDRTKDAKDAGPIQRIETLETKIKETVMSSYIPKYTSSSKNNLTVIQKIAKEKQLSTISQVSNSNHSQNPSYQVEGKEQKQKTFEKYRHTQNNTRENAESNIIIERPSSNVKPLQTNNWIKNTTSQIGNSHQTTAKPQEKYKNMDFTLHKLESSEGFSITRTVTQENFMNMNKINQIQARLQQRQRQFSAINSQGKTAEPQKSQPAPTPTTYNKSFQENTVNQGQKINDDKSEIQKLKEKYSISSNKYTNPYREKKNDSSSTYIKEPTSTKEVKQVKIESRIERQVKAEPRNNEVISKQIEKLDMKIKQIQQNKKDLNINFRPYDISKSVSKPPTSEVPQILASNAQKPEPRQAVASNAPINSASYDRNKYNVRYQAYLERVKPLYSQITLPEPTKIESSGFAIKLMPVEYNNDEASQTDRSEVSSKSRIKQYKNKVDLENRTDIGIEERKKKLQDKVEISNTIKNLVKSFGQQAVLDEAFRNNKIWFASQRDKKWAELKKQLYLVSINLSQNDLKNIFNLEESENNPFFSVSDNKCNMKTLAQSYKQAQSHWQQKIVRKFNRNDLEKEGFTSAKIDYDKKGHIEIEDLVRFLNIESGSFLRNRDVSIIFKRIANNGNKLSFNQFLSAISE